MKNSILSRLTITLCALFMITGAAQAQNAILVVDSGKVLRESSAGKSVYSQLASIQKTIESEAKSALSPLQGEKASIEAQTQGLSVAQLQSRPELAKKIKSFQEKGAKAQVEMQYKGAELQATERKALVQVSKKIDSVIAALAKERGAAGVFDKSMMLYTGSSVDVTQEVISRLNRQLPSVTVVRERLPRKS